MEEEYSTYKCTECNVSASVVFDPFAGSAVCSLCGLILSSCIISDEAEFVEEYEEGVTQHQYEHHLTIGEFHTEIGNGGPSRRKRKTNRNGKGCGIDESPESTAAFLQQISKGMRFNKKERIILNGFSSIKTASPLLEVTDHIMENAMTIFEEYINSKEEEEASNISTKKTESFAAASFYASCRMESKARSLKEVANAFNSTVKLVAKSFTIIVQKLNLKVEGVSTSDYIPRICNKLDIPHQIISAATYLADKAIELGLNSSSSAINFSVACIYFTLAVSGDLKSMLLIATAADVKKVKAIKDVYKELHKQRFELVSDEFTQCFADKGFGVTRLLDALAPEAE